MNQRIFGVTGATGFIGRHLIDNLLAKGSHTVALVRHPENFGIQGVQVRRADIFDLESMSNALRGIDTVYYLVHSMKSKGREFALKDREGAKNFLDAAESSGVRRIIYLGGLGETSSGLSEHLKSRTEVGRILQSGRIPTTVLRAAIIIGPGSASWEMLRQLVERLPVMTTPKWVETKCQPIALRDVLQYLAGCGEMDATEGETLDIGGPDILTYRQMMMKVAALLGKRVRIYGIPILSPRLSSYWVDLVTDVPSNVARPLIDGLRNEVICRNDKIKTLIPIDLTPFSKAIELAINGTV